MLARMVVAKKTLIATRASTDTKHGFAAAAADRGMSESDLLRQLIHSVLDEVVEAPSAPGRAVRKERMSLRYRHGDGALLEARAKARNMKPASYLSMLVHAHVRSEAPLPNDEVNALKACVAELSAVGRNLNQIARSLNLAGAGEGDAVLVETLSSVRGQVDALRSTVADLVRANLVSWESGDA